jgi:hypothetical protein
VEMQMISKLQKKKIPKVKANENISFVSKQ